MIKWYADQLLSLKPKKFNKARVIITLITGVLLAFLLPTIKNSLPA